MIINVEFLELQCRLLGKAFFSEELFVAMMDHPVMMAFLEHEEMLDRGTTGESIRIACQSTIVNGAEESTLMLCKARDVAEQLLDTANTIQQNRQQYQQQAMERIRRFTDSELDSNTVVFLYAMGRDGGFSPREGELYINLLTNQDDWLDVLCHELYHARILNTECIEKRLGYLNLTVETDVCGDMLLSELAEEGIATLIQYHGNLTTDFAAIQDYLNQLKKWGTLTVEERQRLYHALSAGPQRYAFAGYLAEKVLDAYGRSGLEEWSCCGSLRTFHKILECA